MKMRTCDVAIVGAGPAGLSAALYAARALLKAVVVEKEVVGGLITTTTEVDNYPGSAPGATGISITDRMREQAEEAGAEFILDTIGSLEASGSGFTAKLDYSEEIYARAAIIATGTFSRLLGIPGEKELRGRGVSYCATCDAGFFRNKRVAVIGGGDTAIKEAAYLAKFASEVSIVHRRDQLRASAAVQRHIEGNPKIRFLMDKTILSIDGEAKVSGFTAKDNKTGETERYSMDGVFIFAGMAPYSANFSNLVETDPDGYIITNEKMQTSTRGLYAAGDVRKKPLRQVITAVSDGAVAGVEAEKFLSGLE
ncbi:MAG: thioredoxin-disulfide reductase [Eubacteriaceae bacterium]|nr:thioredoxin-disulfide reductase [Eubacteriaceae bacterium]